MGYDELREKSDTLGFCNDTILAPVRPGSAFELPLRRFISVGLSEDKA